MSPSFRRALALLAGTAFLLVSTIVQVGSLLDHWARAKRYFGMSAFAATCALHGEPAAAEFARLRELIPPGGTYLVSDASEWGGEVNWLRFELAPRRPFLVSRVEAARETMLVQIVPRDIRVLVRAEKGDAAPTILDPTLHFASLPGIAPVVEDVGIPANIDSPIEGGEVKGDLVVEAWCEERTGGACAGMYFKVDGEWRLPNEFSRFPRADLNAAIPGIGEALQAGFRARFRLATGDHGVHELIVLAVTPDSRFRRLGPRRFKVSDR